MDETQVQEMAGKLRNNEPHVRTDTPDGTDVFYMILNNHGKFIAKWEIDVQLDEGDRSELYRWKSFGLQSEAVDYLLDDREDPMRHREVLLDT